MELNTISREIIGSAIKVHRALGPGLLESAYEACLQCELHRRGMLVQSQVELPVIYEGFKLDTGYRLDLLVEESVIVEIKAVGKLAPIHEAQLISYLKLSKLKLGLLINFHVMRLVDGIVRRVL